MLGPLVQDSLSMIIEEDEEVAEQYGQLMMLQGEGK
jgi:hypothetical protein